MYKSVLFILTFLSSICSAQQLEKIMLGDSDPYYYYFGDGDTSDLYYYQIVPENEPRGTLVLFPSGGETIQAMLKQIDLHTQAYKNDILVVIPSYNWGTFQKIPDINFLDSLFELVVTEHQVSKDKFVFCGLSNGGITSLKYGIAAVRDSSTYLTPKGIIGIDPPLDLVRFYGYFEREIARNFHEGGVREAQFLMNSYHQIYQGSPEEQLENYIHGSIYSHGVDKGGNAQYLTDVAIRLYSDLNIDFLINQRKRDLYDWNGIDIVAFVNQLKINGNQNAEAIISQNKGVRADGTAHPHSWSILDTDDTMNWILNLFE